MFLTASAHAEVIATSVNLVLGNPMQTIDLDVDNNGTVDFQLFYDVYQDEPFLHINVPTALQSTNKIVVTGDHNTFGKDLVAKLAKGSKIYEGSQFNGQIFGNGPLMAQPDFAGWDILEGRDDINVGISFDQDGEMHYGWMTISVNAAGTQARVTAFVYETIAGRSVYAGVMPLGVERQDPIPFGIRQIGEKQFEVSGEADIEVVDLLGRQLMRFDGKGLLDLRNLVPGVYFLKPIGRTGETVEKVSLR
jgi:hypothetical protein